MLSVCQTLTLVHSRNGLIDFGTWSAESRGTRRRPARLPLLGLAQQTVCVVRKRAESDFQRSTLGFPHHAEADR